MRQAIGGECLPLTADLFSPEDCRRVVDETAVAFGRLDALVNNASTNVDRTPASLVEASDDQLLERFLGKTMATIRCTRAAIPAMRRGGGGRVVCIGGTSARSIFREGELPTSSSNLPQGLGNGGIATFARYAAEEGAKDGIVVNVVHPHLTKTDRHEARMQARARQTGATPAEVENAAAAQMPIRRLLETSDIVPLVLLLASPLASAITGQAIAVDGGAVRSINY